MCFNNVGVAHADLGDASSARDAWEHALALDPLYPVPYANLAALAAADGNVDQAASLLLRARQLGYTGGSLDRATHRVQQLLAAIESKGPSVRSEEHTSELQSLMRISYAVFCLKTKT